CNRTKDFAQIEIEYSSCSKGTIAEIKEYCVEIQDGTETGVCNTGYEGMLCAECAEGWGKSKPYECVKFDASVSFFVIMVSFVLFKIGLIGYVVHEAREESYKDKYKVHATMLRILITFFQIESMLLSVRMQWPLLLNGIRSFIISVFNSSLNPGGYSYYCLLHW